MSKSTRPPLIFSILGALLGYLLLHPYTMIVYTLAHWHQSGKLFWGWGDILDLGLAGFKPAMIPMAIPFILSGGVVGLLIGLLVEKKKRLLAAEIENERKKIALETLQQLMVTLSHYLLNANMIIGGKVGRLKRTVSDEELLAAFEIIAEEARKIDTVISTLNKMTEIKTSQYISQGKALLIDLTQEIEESLSRNQERGIRERTT